METHNNNNVDVMAVNARIVTVTPTMAQKWLDDGASNRKIRNTRVERYARDMTAGKWMINGEPIKFDILGRLIDGQHRLQACIAADVSFDTWIITGLPIDAFKTLDSNAVRTPADVIGMEMDSEGKDETDKHASSLSSALNLTMRREHGYMTSHYPPPTHIEYLELRKKHPKLERFVNLAYPGRAIIPCSILGAVAYWGSEIWDDETAELFIRQVVDGANLRKTDAVFQLRERLISSRRAKSTKGHRDMIIKLTIKAFNCAALGIPCDMLAVRSDENPVLSKTFKPRRMRAMSKIDD